jgi:double-stranded uracil-DNA glycosylase
VALELVPAVVACTGKGVYLTAARVTRSPWGLQPEPLFGTARDFVPPSPSGLVRMGFGEKLEPYQALSQLLEGGTSI